MKKKIKDLFCKVKTFLKRVKDEKLVSQYIKENPIFFAYVVVNVFNSTLLRFLTMHTVENFLAIKPIIADLAIIIIFGSFCFFFKNKGKSRYLFILTIIFTAVCMINSIYYTFYTSFASISMLSLTQFIAPVGDAVVENVLQLKDLTYIVGPVALIIVIFKFRNKKDFINNKDKQLRKKKAINTLMTGFGFLFIFVITLTTLDVSRFVKQWNKEYVVMRFGIYIYQGNDLISSLQPKINSMFGFDKAKKNFNDYFNERKEIEKYSSTNEYTNIFEGKNVIVLHAESLQNVAINRKFNGEEVTPTFNRIAKEGIYFSNFYSQVGVGTSSDAEFTYNTSLMPSKSGTAFVSYFDREFISTPKLLKEKGYYTFSMHGNTADFWNRRVMHENLGYDRFYSKADYEVTKENSIGLGISDKDFFSQSVSKIKEVKESNQLYYGLMISLTNHTPFSDVDKYGEFAVDIKEEVTKEDGSVEVVSHPYMEETKLGNYFKSVHYADSAFGEFLDTMDKEGLLDNTVLIIYGDHDARLPKKEYNKLYNYDPSLDDIKDEDAPDYYDFDSYQYELNRKVPFMIWTKDKKFNKEVTDVMGMYDVMPTIGNMLGFSNDYALGHDIFSIKENNIVVFPNGNFITNKVYYDSQKGEYLSLNSNEIIDENYISNNSKYAEKLLDVSNDIIVFDLINKTKDENLSVNKN